jgi:hypothetical protein
VYGTKLAMFAAEFRGLLPKGQLRSSPESKQS